MKSLVNLSLIKKSSLMKKKEHKSKSLLWRFFLVLFAFSMSFNLYAQEITTTGTVVDQNGEPLIGVTVSVMKGSNGTITDIDGNFSIKCNKGATLKFSYIGYKDATQVAMGTKMNIVLTEDAQALDEVVVIGYGTVKKRDLTGAISTVNAKTIEERQPTDIFQALQGEVSGLQISNNSGAPGDTGTMLIRGASTMGSGVTPLYIVDGVAVDNISTINPADIESMEILKDAASAAIYGSRSAAGVIIISTKRGKEGAPARISVKYNHSMKKLGHKIDQANAFERYLKERAGNAGTSLWKTSNDSLHPNFMADNDYQDLITRMAHSNQVDINISGAKNKMSYYTSIGYLNEQGIVLNSYLNRVTSRTNVDFAVSDRFKLMSRFNVAYTDKNNINTGGVINQALRRPPQMALYFPDGSYVYNNGGQFNPIADAYERVNKSVSYSVSLYQGAEFQLMKGLIWSANVQGELKVNRNDQLIRGDLVSSGISSGSNDAKIPRKLSAETYINFARDFKDHSVGAMFGTSVEDWRDETFHLEGSDYVSESILTSNAQQVKDLTKTKTTYESHAMASFFGRVNYSYKGKYIFTSNLRYDGSSRFVGNRWGLFPSASVAWRASDEFFFDWAKPVLTDAKFRLSWGTNGNERVGNYESINQYNIGSYYNGVIGVTQTDKLANLDLSWESTEQTNIGLDVTLLDGRVSLVAEYYIKKTKDLLADEVIPSELGVSSMRVNMGNIENKGMEFSLGYNKSWGDFSWNSNLTFSFNKNKIVELLDDAVDDEGNHYSLSEIDKGGIGSAKVILRKGGSMGDMYVTNRLKRDNEGNVFIDKASQNVKKEDIKNSDEFIHIGSVLPKSNLGFRNDFSYKGISLGFMLAARFGGIVISPTQAVMDQFGVSKVTALARDNEGVPVNNGKVDPQTYYTEVGGISGLMSNYVYSATNVRLQELSVGYSLPAKWFNNKCNLSLSITGHNLWMIYNKAPFDPEATASTGTYYQGVDYFMQPSLRSWGFNVKIQF